jgi:hypothetical protein
MNIRLKITAFLLIQAFLSCSCAWPADNTAYADAHQTSAAMLSPRLIISQEQFHEYVLRSLLPETGVVDIAAQVIEPKITLAVRIKHFFEAKSQKIDKIVSLVIKGGHIVQKKKAVRMMTLTNILVDIGLTNIFLKPGIIAWGIFSGDMIIGFLAFCLTFVIGGLVRLGYYPIFKIIWPDIFKITSSGLTVNFVPWGFGNFAPLFFANGKVNPNTIAFIKEVYDISNIVERSIEHHTMASVAESTNVMENSVEIAEAIYRQQMSFRNYNYRRFKIRGTKEYSAQQIISLISRRDFSDKYPFFNRFKKRILKLFGITSPGYRRGTRPFLLFATGERIAQIRQYLINAHLDAEHLLRVYQFDISEYAVAMREFQKGQLRVKPAPADFIRPMFPEGQTGENDSLGKTALSKIDTLLGPELKNKIFRFYQKISRSQTIKSVLYQGSGADIIVPFILTNAERLIMIDHFPFGTAQDAAAAEFLKEKYFKAKRDKGVISMEILSEIGNLRAPIIWELECMNAQNIDIIVRSSRAVEIKFDWAYPGQASKQRTIILAAQTDARNPDLYSTEVVEELDKGIDAYLLKGSGVIGMDEHLQRYLYERLNKNALLITNQPRLIKQLETKFKPIGSIALSLMVSDLIVYKKQATQEISEINGIMPLINLPDMVNFAMLEQAI